MIGPITCIRTAPSGRNTSLEAKLPIFGLYLYIGFILYPSMASEVDFGLPHLVMSLLEDQKSKEGVKLKCKVVMEGSFTQVTLTWLPVSEANTHVKSGSGQLHKPYHLKGMRKKAPCELRRDASRKEAYLKGVQQRDSKNNVGTTNVKTVNNEVKCDMPRRSQQTCAVSSTPIVTRSKSKACAEIERPRENDSLQDAVFISPAKCDISSSSDCSADPSLVDTDICLPVTMATTDPHESGSQSIDSHASVDLTGDMDSLKTVEDITQEGTVLSTPISDEGQNIKQSDMLKLMNALKSFEDNFDRKINQFEIGLQNAT